MISWLKQGFERFERFEKLVPDRRGLFRGVAVGVVVLGIIFRLGNLSLKPYWEDEAFTSAIISGYELETIEADLQNRLTSVESLAKYQDVRLGKSWTDTAIALAKRPEHTPIYFLLARAWALCFGSSVAAMRAFPAITSLLTLPLFYWLSRLLFNSSKTATVALCLACTSPIFIRYAQDARPYSLWVVGMLLSSVMLLRALKYNKRQHWVLYGLSVAFSGLVHWLSGLVFLAHSCYVLFAVKTLEQTEKNKRKRFLVALLVGLLPLLPWLGLVIYGRYSVRAVLSWLEQEETLVELVIKWLGNVSHLIFAKLPPGNSSLLLIVPLLVLLAWSAAQLIVKERSRQWLLPVALCAIPTVAFVIPDLLFGGTRSLISRYFLPADIGAILILAFGLSTSDGATKPAKWTARVRQVLFYAVLTIAISACWFNFTADNWWGEADSGTESAAIALQTASAVDVYSDQRISPFLAFALSLRPSDRIMWLDAEEPFSTDVFNEMFNRSKTALLFEPSDALLDSVEQASVKRGFKIVSASNDVSAKNFQSERERAHLLKIQPQ